MPYKNNLTIASSLKKELDGFRPLTTDMERRIMQKFRLDWNYHSSHIEGNQLTYGETKALILFGQTAQAKPLKDHIEMTGHDEAVKEIEEIISQERPLTESFIRELHLLLLKKPYEVDAVTPDGKPTKRTIAIGKYKTAPNHVKTQTGEIFYFAKPEETPAKMNDLMQWYHENLLDQALHPVLFATEFHYRFIRIHPFDDGNGRLARLLMNFILMQKGYPPAIIKTEDKANYFNALQQADAGQLDFFFSYICEQVNKSLSIMINGAKGESIEEDSDLDKEIALWKNTLHDKQVKVLPLSDEIVYLLYINGIQEMFELYIEKMKQFNELFLNVEVFGLVNNVYFENSGTGDTLLNKAFNDLLMTKPAVQIKDMLFKIKDQYSINTITIVYNLSGFKCNGTNSFELKNTLFVEFNSYCYRILYNGDLLYEIYNSDYLENQVAKGIINTCIKKTLDQIKSKIKTE